MNAAEFSQWLATNPPLSEIEDVIRQCEAIRQQRVSLENKWDRPITPYTGWGTEQQRCRLFMLCEAITEQGFQIKYDLDCSSDTFQRWVVSNENQIGSLAWVEQTDEFVTSPLLPFYVNQETGTLVFR